MNDLRGRNKHEGADMGRTGKIVGGAIVLAVIAGVAIYNYEAGTFNYHPKQMVATNETQPPSQP